MQSLALLRANTLQYVRLSKILCLYAEDKYTIARVECESKPFFISTNPSLLQLEPTVVNAGFMRVNRDCLANRHYFDRLVRLERLKYQLVLRDGFKISVSRRNINALKALFKGACNV